jgi:hypothetical protein
VNGVVPVGAGVGVGVFSELCIGAGFVGKGEGDLVASLGRLGMGLSGGSPSVEDIGKAQAVKISGSSAILGHIRLTKMEYVSKGALLLRAL